MYNAYFIQHDSWPRFALRSKNRTSHVIHLWYYKKYSHIAKVYLSVETIYKHPTGNEIDVMGIGFIEWKATARLLNTIFIVANINCTVWSNYFKYGSLNSFKFIFHIPNKFAIWKSGKLHTVLLFQTTANGTFYFRGRMEDTQQQQQNIEIFIDFLIHYHYLQYIFSCHVFFFHAHYSVAKWVKIPLLNNLWVCWKIVRMQKKKITKYYSIYNVVSAARNIWA